MDASYNEELQVMPRVHTSFRYPLANSGPEDRESFP